jgi:hypothetical protein
MSGGNEPPDPAATCVFNQSMINFAEKGRSSIYGIPDVTRQATDRTRTGG